MVNIQRGNVYAKKPPAPQQQQGPGWFEKYVVAPAVGVGTAALSHQIGEWMPSAQAKTDLMKTQTQMNKQMLADPDFAKKMQAMKRAGLVG